MSTKPFYTCIADFTVAGMPCLQNSQNNSYVCINIAKQLGTSNFNLERT